MAAVFGYNLIAAQPKYGRVTLHAVGVDHLMSDPIEATTESAKAVQEVAKTSGQAITFTQGLADWLGVVIGNPIALAVTAYVSNPIQAKILRDKVYDEARLRDLTAKVDRIFDGRDVHTRELPPKVAFPLLEAATREYEDRLHSLWAELLATAIDADEDPVETQFVTILSELSLEDAMALSDYWDAWQHEASHQTTSDGSVVYGPSIETGNWGGRIAATLFRLGLVTPSYIEFETFEPGGHNRYGDYGPTKQKVQVPGSLEFVVFTPLGEAFCRAVGMKDGIPPDLGETPDAGG